MTLLKLFEDIVCYRIGSAEDVALEIRSIMRDFARLEYKGVVVFEHGDYHWFRTIPPYSSILTDESQKRLERRFLGIRLKFDDGDILNFYIPVGLR